MAFIASSSEARELISKKIGDSEIEDKILRKRNDGIPAFGFQQSVTNPKFETYVANLTNKAMAKIVANGIPSDDIIKSVFKKSTDAETIRNHFTELVKNPNKQIQHLFSETAYIHTLSRMPSLIITFLDSTWSTLRLWKGTMTQMISRW